MRRELGKFCCYSSHFLLSVTSCGLPRAQARSDQQSSDRTQKRITENNGEKETGSTMSHVDTKFRKQKSRTESATAVLKKWDLKKSPDT